MDEKVFEISQSLIYQMSNLPNTSLNDFASLTFAEAGSLKINLTASEVEECLKQTDKDQLCLSIQYAYNTFVNRTEQSMWILYSPTFDPLSNLGVNWLKLARNLTLQISDNSDIDIFICGFNSESIDAVQAGK
jgi:hypothetical protein